MTRKEELLFAFLSGVLLAFGIRENSKEDRRALATQGSLEHGSEEIGKYWEQVGGFLSYAQASEQKGAA